MTKSMCLGFYKIEYPKLSLQKLCCDNKKSIINKFSVLNAKNKDKEKVQCPHYF